MFRDPRNEFRGLPTYKTLFWSIRFHARLFFGARRVDVARVWQPADAEIRVRWSATGVSRLPWRPVGVFDGVSTFRLDSDGLIFEHSVDNLALRPPPAGATSPWLAALNMVPRVEGALAPQGQGGGSPCPNWTDPGEGEIGAHAAAVAAAAAMSVAPPARGGDHHHHHPPLPPPTIALGDASSLGLSPAAVCRRAGEPVAA